MSKATKRRLNTILLYLVLVLISVIMIFPIYWTFTTAFKEPKDVITNPPKYVPFLDYQPSLYAWQELGFVPGSGEEYRTTPHSAGEILGVMKNSAIAAVGSTLLSLIIGCPAAYSLARFRFQRWKNRDIAFFVLSQRMLPPIVLVIPFFILFRTFGLLDNIVAVILAHSVGSIPFVVWIMREFFLDIPKELEDSARIDGCSYLGAFTRVVLPLSTPGMVAASVFTFIFSWNEFLFALTLTFNKARTIPVLLAGLTHGGAPLWWDLSAMLLIAIVPVIVFTLFIQKYIISGLTLGALK
ncbi:MAG: carbohydrate ABC transporter permease [Anaerolineae bacterium]